MADLSERLGLERAMDVSFRAAGSFQHTAACIEADRRATVEAVARWLMGQGYGGDKLTRGEVAELIGRELLAPPSPGEGLEPGSREHLEQQIVTGAERLVANLQQLEALYGDGIEAAGVRSMRAKADIVLAGLLDSGATYAAMFRTGRPEREASDGE